MVTKTKWTWAGALALALVTVAGCISLGGGGGGGPVVPPPPEPPAIVAVNFRVHDFVQPAEWIADAQISCPDAAPATTDADGRATLQLQAKQQDCTITKDGYRDTQIGVLPGAEDPVGASLTKKPGQPPPAKPVQVSRNARSGQLRLTAAGYADDSGPVLPLYAHAGDLFWLFTTDRARAESELNDVAAAGYQGVRTWAALGCGPNTPAGCPGGAYWKGREVGPEITPDYWGQVRAFADALRARGLRAVWSQGDIGQLRDRRGYMTQLAQVDLAAPFIDFLDCGNEAWQTGEPDPGRLAQCVGYYQQAGGRAIRSLTSPPGEGKDELDRFSIDPAQVFDVHTFRDNHSWDKRRHIFSIPYEVKPVRRFGIGSEPPGGGELVSVTANKHELDDESVPLLAVASMIGRQAFVWFSGEGVKLQRGLKSEPGFYTTPKAVDLLPKDVMAFPVLHHGGDSWRDVRVLAAEGETRVDCAAHPDGRFVCTIDGPAVSNQQLRVERGFVGRICDAGAGSCVDVSGKAGEREPVSFRRGRVFVGRLQ
jgi:hypothetical protein